MPWEEKPLKQTMPNTFNPMKVSENDNISHEAVMSGFFAGEAGMNSEITRDWRSFMKANMTRFASDVNRR